MAREAGGISFLAFLSPANYLLDLEGSIDQQEVWFGSCTGSIHACLIAFRIQIEIRFSLTPTLCRMEYTVIHTAILLFISIVFKDENN